MPGKNAPPSKNRVWGFSGHSRSPARRSASQVLEPQQENRPTPTAIVSGVHYYGYRYYSPELGRWPSRDPIGERGGLNLYGFLDNNSSSLVDLWGWMAFSSGVLPLHSPHATFEVRAQDLTPELSDTATETALWAASGALNFLGAFGLNFGNNGYTAGATLLRHYLRGSGTEMSVNFGLMIDQEGGLRVRRVQEVVEAIESLSALPAGQFKGDWEYEDSITGGPGGWQTGINSHSFGIEGTIISGPSKITATFKFKLYDAYQFMPDASMVGTFGVDNAHFARLHRVSRAKDFLVRGESARTKIYWRKPPVDG